MKYLLNILSLVVVCTILSVSLSAQNNYVKSAVVLYQNQKLDSAAIFISKAIEDEETSDKASTYYYAGIIFKDIYNKREKTDHESPYRDQAIESFTKFLQLNEDEKLVPAIEKSLTYLINTVYNDAVVLLNKNTYKKSIELFNKYKKLQGYNNPDADISKIDIQYHLVLGQVFSELYENDRESNETYYNKVVETYQYIIDIDPENWSANYNLGIHYYNEAVNKIKDLDYDLDLITLELIQDECVEIFKQALPYMKKAYELNPKRKETLIGLSGIYFSLNELELSEEFTEKLKALEGEK